MDMLFLTILGTLYFAIMVFVVAQYVRKNRESITSAHEKFQNFIMDRFVEPVSRYSPLKKKDTPGDLQAD